MEIFDFYQRDICDLMFFLHEKIIGGSDRNSDEDYEFMTQEEFRGNVSSFFYVFGHLAG